MPPLHTLAVPRGYVVPGAPVCRGTRPKFPAPRPTVDRGVFSQRPAGGHLIERGTVSAHYDPMLAKLIAHGDDREQVLARLDQ
jgi:hypothetical protein